MKISSTERETLADRGNISRRTLVQSAAWSVPVIAAAAAAPLAAASADACIEQSVELVGVSIAWNDGAGGQNSNGTYGGHPTYGPNQGMFADFTLRNAGTATVSGFEVIFNLRKGLWATGSLRADALRPDNTNEGPGELQQLRQNGATPNLDSIPFHFDGLILEPGQTIRFRLHWTTAASTGGQYLLSGLYGIGFPRSILCNDVHVPRSLQDETIQNNNDALPINNFYVRA